MDAAAVVPEGLADLPPCPRLAALLADIDLARVPNNQLLPVLLAQSRQAAHEAARLLGVIAEIARVNPTFDDDAVDRLDHPFLHAADEVRAALAWSLRAADRETDLADQLVHDLPQVYAAHLGGRIDRPKVRVFADHLTGLTPDQTEQICTTLVPIAHRLTPGQLAHRLRRLLAAIDPRHYERRYRKALRDRFVTAHLDDTGTAVLTARGLSPEQATAALERIDLLAHATRRAGHRSTLDQIRVDILAGLLDGTLHHLSRDQIITHLLSHRAAHDDAPTTAGADDTADPGDAADDDRPAGTRSAGPDDHTPSGRPSANDSVPEPTLATPEAAADVAAGTARATGSPDDQRIGIEVRVALSTLLGHDDQPGEIPGLGPIPAAHAREIVARQRRAEWRFAVTDDQGMPVFDGITRRRPRGQAPTGGPPGGIVELHIPATALTDPIDTAGWAAVVADLATQYDTRETRDLDAHPHDRLPRTGLRRHVQIRDRTCVDRPRRCDQDHTLDHRHGGDTVAADLAPLCRHDHTLKHQGGWTLEQPAPGEFLWTSPLGGRYPVRPEPILPPLPEPCPRDDDPTHDEPALPGPEKLELPQPDPPPPPPPAPPPVDLDEPPPF